MRKNSFVKRLIRRLDSAGSARLSSDISLRNNIPSWLSRIVLVTLVDATVLRVVLPFVKRLTYFGDDVTREESKI